MVVVSGGFGVKLKVSEVVSSIFWKAIFPKPRIGFEKPIWLLKMSTAVNANSCNLNFIGDRLIASTNINHEPIPPY